MKEIKLKEDLEKIYPLIKQLRNNLSLKDFLDKIQLATQTQHYKLFAYENEGSYKAACGVMPFNVLYHNHCLYICDFVVDEALRGKGIGQAFLKKIQIWAKDQGYEELELSSSFFRTQAHEFYIQKMGFEKSGFVFKKNIKNKMKEFKDQEKDIDIYSILKTHMPIIACIAAAIISAMFLFKGLNNVSTLDILQNFWIIGIIGTISYVVTFAIVKIVKKTELNKTTDRIFSWFQIFTASSFAFSHGANDIANAIGPFAAILDVLKNGTINATSPVPFAALAMFGVALVVGLWFLGKEVITTVGSKLATIRPTTGFSAELGASIVILLATQFGIPVSSTHILIGAILGIGVYNKNANWIMMKPIGLAWIITLPAAGIMAALVFLGFKLSLGI